MGLSYLGGGSEKCTTGKLFNFAHWDDYKASTNESILHAFLKHLVTDFQGFLLDNPGPSP